MRPTLFALALVGVSMAAMALADDGAIVTVHPLDTGAALCNPGMGWVFHHYDNSLHGYGPPLGPGYDGSEFPGLTVAYFRLAWSYLEPKEGVFDWSIVDTPAARYIAAGKKIAFRITCYEGSNETPYATPKWVRDAGAKGYDLGKFWEPDYDDPIFLSKLAGFLKAFGARYDGNPNVAFVDVGTLGIWGEGHPIARDYGLATVERHIDLHRRYFPHTLLAVNDDFATWYGDDDLQKVGTVDVPVSFGIPKTAWGQSFPVYAGLWIPGDTSRPEARLLPSNGNDDRRVPIGTITISDTGQTAYAVKLPPDTPGGDYEITHVTFRQSGERGILSITWQIRKAIAHNVQPFCHLDRDGKIALGGGRFAHSLAAINYARKLGMTLRDDSILVSAPPNAYYSAGMAQAFWPTVPVILESGHYDYAKKIRAWGDGSEYLHAVEDYHASYASIHANPIEFLAENRDLIHRMNLRLGYRLDLVEASWPAEAPKSGSLTIRSQWANVAVAPCYCGGYPAWWLFDAHGHLMAGLVDDGLQVRDLKLGPPGKAPVTNRERSFLLPPGLPAGEYEIRVSVGDATGTPTLALPLAGDDGHKRYTLGKITLR